MTTPLDLVRYGWGLVWWATVEGIPVVWSTLDVALSLPTGFATLDASLRVADVGSLGCEVQPDTGVAAGLPFALELLDSTEARGWMAWPTVARRLAANISASATSIALDSVSGLSSPVWIGNERITYSGTSGGNTLTGCTRGTGGSLAYAHRADGAGALVTDAPRPDWRGRRVRLYVAAVDPAGTPYGTNLESISVEVWSGYVDEGPYRSERATWIVDCLPLVRRLGETLPPSHSGVVDGKTRWHTVQSDELVSFEMVRIDGAGTVSESFAFVVYDASTLGATIATKAASTIRQDFQNAWNAAVSALGGSPFVGELHFEWHAKQSRWRAMMKPGTSPPNDFSIKWKLVAGGSQIGNEGYLIGAFASQFAVPLWSFPSSPMHPNASGVQEQLVVQLSTSLPADVTAPGALVIDDKLHTFATVATLEGAVRLGGVEPPLLPSDVDGADVQLLQYAEGGLAEVALRVIESSGTSSLRGSFDTLASDAGYAIDDAQIDEDTFEAVGGALAGVQVAGIVSGRSFEAMFGGLLGLAERCVVQRVVDGVCKLALVATSPIVGGSKATITDDDLLTAASEQPVAVERWSRVPTVVEVEVGVGFGASTQFVMVRDASRRQSVGAVVLSTSTPLVDVSEAASLVAVWAGSRFGRPQTAEAIRLRVGPWIDVDVGDGVQLELTHGALYDRRNGSEGYVGPARVVGRTIEPASGVVSLTLLPAIGAGLAPAAQVQAYAGTAGAPTSIDVPLQYLPHFQRAIESGGGTAKALHFAPGANETVAEGYTFRAAAAVGGFCRLTVQSIIGTPTLATSGDRSYLTIPTSGDVAIAPYQEAFAHTDDAGWWA